MGLYIAKIGISALIIAVVSEISKKHVFWGSLLASLPIVSILAIVWLFIETKDVQKVCNLSTSILYMLIPSLALFVALPLLLKAGYNFAISLLASSTIMVTFYLCMVKILSLLGIKS